MSTKKYDDKVQQWIDLVHENINKDPEQTLVFCNEIIRYGLQEEDPYLLGYGYFYCGEVYYCLNDGDLFFESVTKALGYLVFAQEWELMAKCYNFLGIMAFNSGNIPVALEYYSNGIRICDIHELHRFKIILQINIGAVHIECQRYEDALSYMDVAYHALMSRKNDPSFHNYMLCIFENAEKCLIAQGDYERIEKIREVIRKEHWEFFNDVDKISISFVEAVYLDKCRQLEERDRIIQWIDENISDSIPVLDLMDDIYMYCRMLIECQKQKDFLHIITLLDPVVESLNVTRIQQKLISLKMQFYRWNKQRAEYLECASTFYELSELMEMEQCKMNNNVIALRRSLERSDRVRRKVEMQNQILLEKSQTDALTNLGNRFQFNDYSETAFTKAIQDKSSFAIEILDVDYFKEYNDNYGHQKGDACLVSIARVLREMQRKCNAFCARYGGDEFILIYRNITQEQLKQNAITLREKVMELGIAHKYAKNSSIVTISQGICWGMPDSSSRLWDYLHSADDMLYRVKKASRNNYCICDITDTEQVIIGDQCQNLIKS